MSVKCLWECVPPRVVGKLESELPTRVGVHGLPPTWPLVPTPEASAVCLVTGWAAAGLFQHPVVLVVMQFGS